MSDISDDLLGDYDLDELGAPKPDCKPCGVCGGSRVAWTAPDENGLSDGEACPHCRGPGVEP